MSLSINTNIAALIALDHLDQTDLNTQNSIERLSTGLRINSGADDPAGMIISQGMQSQLKGIGQAIQNTQNADNMAKTADGALSEIQSLLLDLRALTVHASNAAVLDTASVQADQTQVQSILQSINRIASTTQFSNKKLLDGSAGALANVTNANAVSSMYVSGSFAGNILQSGPVTITKVTSAQQATQTLGQGFGSTSAIVSAGTMVINGYSISTDGTETVSTLVSKINAVAGTTGVTAALSQASTSPVKYSVVLAQQNYGARYSINFFDPNKIIDTATSRSVTGVDAVYNVSASTNSGAQTTLFTGGRGGTDSGLKLTDIYGNSILLSQSGNASITTLPTQIGQITAGSVQFQIGPESNQAVSFALPNVFARNLGAGVVAGKTLGDIDLTTVVGANQAMDIVEEAVKQVATARGQIGSFQKNVLQASSTFLQVANTNLSASASNIQDADMAAEMTKFTKLQILRQSGISVLAQANASPQAVLSLLKGA